MATEVYQFTANIPIGASPAAPFMQPMTLPPRIVQGIEIIVPPGPSGQVGFAITNSGIRVIPYQSDQWIITAAEKIAWPLEAQITSGDWGLIGYNTGTTNHVVFVRFLVVPVTAAVRPASDLIPSGDLVSADTVLVAADGTVIG